MLSVQSGEPVSGTHDKDGVVSVFNLSGRIPSVDQLNGRDVQDILKFDQMGAHGRIRQLCLHHELGPVSFRDKEIDFLLVFIPHVP